MISFISRDLDIFFRFFLKSVPMTMVMLLIYFYIAVHGYIEFANILLTLLACALGVKVVISILSSGINKSAAMGQKFAIALTAAAIYYGQSNLRANVYYVQTLWTDGIRSKCDQAHPVHLPVGSLSVCQVNDFPEAGFQEAVVRVDVAGDSESESRDSVLRDIQDGKLESDVQKELRKSAQLWPHTFKFLRLASNFYLLKIYN